MKIFYFSGTGNSLYISKQIASAFDNSEIVNIVALKKNKTISVNESVIGFVFPCYCQDMPDNVIKFCKQIHFYGNPYIFGIVTNNGEYSTTLLHLNKILRNKKQKLSAGWSLLMPGNSLHFLDYTNDINEQEIRHRNIELRLTNEIIPSIKEQRQLPFEYQPDFKYRIKRQISYNFLYNIYKTHKHFYTDSNCVMCQMCVNLCPQKNINIKNGKVNWGNRCLQCLACLHWCPKKSIQIKNKTEDKSRYTHPKISLKEMLSNGKITIT